MPDKVHLTKDAYTNLADTLSALVERITDMEGEELQTFLGVLTDSKSSDLNPSFTDWRTEKDIITESVLPQVGVNANDGAAGPGDVEEEFQEEDEAVVVIVEEPENSNISGRGNVKSRLGTKRKSSVQDRLNKGKPKSKKK